MSGDGSVEISVPTDLTVTSDGDSEEGHPTAAAAAASRRYGTICLIPYKVLNIKTKLLIHCLYKANSYFKYVQYFIF